jgi:transposase
MGKTYTEEERTRVLQAAEEGENWRLVAAHNGVAQDTARGWVRQARRSGDFRPSPDKRGGAHNRKLGDVHLEFLEERLGENCFLTLREMQDLLLERFGVEVTSETVRANLDAHCFTVK